MPPRKSNVSQATGTDDGGTPVKEREGTNIEVCLVHLNRCYQFFLLLPQSSNPRKVKAKDRS